MNEKTTLTAPAQNKLAQAQQEKLAANTAGTQRSVRIIGDAPQVYTADGGVIVRTYHDRELPWDARHWTYDQRKEIVTALEQEGIVTGAIYTTGVWRYDMPGVPYMLYAQTKRHPMLVPVDLAGLRGSLGEEKT